MARPVLSSSTIIALYQSTKHDEPAGGQEGCVLESFSATEKNRLTLHCALPDILQTLNCKLGFKIVVELVVDIRNGSFSPELKESLAVPGDSCSPRRKADVR